MPEKNFAITEEEAKQIARVTFSAEAAARVMTLSLFALSEKVDDQATRALLAMVDHAQHVEALTTDTASLLSDCGIMSALIPDRLIN